MADKLTTRVNELVSTLSDKMNELESRGATKLEEVTQQAYQNKALYVPAFDIGSGMTYKEGAVDLGVSQVGHQMGLYSLKSGRLTVASGDNSVAMGSSTRAPGANSVAMGSSARALANASVAMGSGTTASREYSTAMGFNTRASGDGSVAMGANAKASGANSFASGFNTTASGSNSTAMGNFTTASGSNSNAMGFIAVASGLSSTAMGTGTESNNYASFAMGRYTSEGVAEDSWIPGSPIFKVGNGSNQSNRNDAYVLYNDGRSEQEGIMEYTSDLSEEFTENTVVTKKYVDSLSEPKVARYSGENSQAGSAHTVELDAEMFNTYNFGLGDGKIRIPENGFYEIAIVGNTLNLSSQMYLEVIIGGVGNLKILVATSPPQAGGMSGTTGVIELELDDIVSVRAQGVPNIGNLKIELSIKKL